MNTRRIHSPPDRTARSARRFVPAITILLAAVLMLLPVPLAWGIMPQLALLLLIFWASVQPRLTPPWAMLLLGLCIDLLFGLPIGIWTVIFPAVTIAVGLLDVRLQASRSFAVDWGLAALLVAVAMFLQWEFLQFSGRSAAGWPLLAQAGTTILAYPAVAAIAAHIQSRLIDFGS